MSRVYKITVWAYGMTDEEAEALGNRIGDAANELGEQVLVVGSFRGGERWRLRWLGKLRKAMSSPRG